MWDIPTESDMNRYLDNIRRIRETIADTTNTPITPSSMNNLTFADANNIEIILASAYKTLVE
jgi:hypothetical protein